jgi:hypothetical protein
MSRLSDLLDAEVRGDDGRSLGPVRDVRLVQDGPVRQGLQASFRVDALVVGGRSFPVRLGYYRGGIRGPLLLRWLFSRLEQRSLIIPMEHVAAWDEETDTVTLRPGWTPREHP